jgi:hypothetical protein
MLRLIGVMNLQAVNGAHKGLDKISYAPAFYFQLNRKAVK